MLEIKLDTGALNALFPEGSEGRVKLSQAVIQNFVNRKFISDSKGNIREQVNAAVAAINLPNVQDEVTKAVNDQFTRHGWSTGVEAKIEVRKAITDAIEKATQETMKVMIDNAIKAVIPGIEETIMKRAAMFLDTSTLQERAYDVLFNNFEETIKAMMKKQLGLNE